MHSKEADTSTCNNNRYNVLGYEQVCRLQDVMEKDINIHGKGTCPSLTITLRELVGRVRNKLEEEGISVRDVRLNGGAAGHIIGMESVQSYNDLDLLFGVDLSCPSILEDIKRVVLDTLWSFLPPNSEELLRIRNFTAHHRGGRSDIHIMEGYIRKLVRIQNTDSWSLISLGNPCAHQPDSLTVELKFVDKMRRKFEFTVDSFQIILDSLINFFSVQPTPAPITEHFYPTVVAESVSGSFSEAYNHLLKKEISTRNPEEIRGGGLLKYCKLLVDRYFPAQGVDVVNLEKYMCSRFFIDFPDLNRQRNKLESYLQSHFPADKELEQRIRYLQILYEVIKSSTVCLMQQERRSILYLISDMMGEIYLEIESRNNVIALEPFNSGEWVLDQVFYGTQYFPNQTTPKGSPVLESPDYCSSFSSTSSTGSSLFGDSSGYYTIISTTSQGHVTFDGKNYYYSFPHSLSSAASSSSEAPSFSGDSQDGLSQSSLTPTITVTAC